MDVKVPSTPVEVFCVRVVETVSVAAPSTATEIWSDVAFTEVEFTITGTVDVAGFFGTGFCAIGFVAAGAGCAGVAACAVEIPGMEMFAATGASTGGGVPKSSTT